MKTVNYSFNKKINEIFLVEPNELGVNFLTNWYKKLVRYFKKTPFLVLIPLSFFIGYLLYLIFGFLVVRLVNLLQYGF